MGREEHQDEQPMLSSAFYVYNRPARDVSWKWLFLLFLAITVIGGIYAGVHRNPDFGTLISQDYLSNPAHCPAHAAGPSRHLLGKHDDFKPTYFLETAGLCTGISILGGLLVGLTGLYTIRNKPHLAVGLAVALQVLLPAAAGVAVLSAGGGAGAVPFFLMAGLIGFVFYLYRQQLQLVGRLLAVSGHALMENPSIVGGSLLLQLAGMVVVVPLLAFVLLAYANGGVVPNPAAISVEEGGKMCLDTDGDEVTCCAWKPDDWAIAYMALGSLMLGWSSLLVFTIKVYVVSGITAQWYFAPANTGPPKGALSRSFRQAFGPSFGSLCLASWLLNLLQMLKSMAESARRDNTTNIFVQLLLSCFEFLITLLEAVTKFAVVRIAITGEPLMEGCRKTTELLSRNLLDTVGVWWFPGMILQVTAFVLAGIWGLAVFAASYTFWGKSDVGLSSGIAMGVVAFFFGLITIAFLNSILLSIVDAVYICFAMDRDAHACSRLEVHQVYDLLPSNKAPGGVVEQPDGNYAFAAGGHSSPFGGQSGYGYPAVPRV
eukprot:gene1350-1691_t